MGADGSTTPIDDRNDRSLSSRFEVEQIRKYLHRKLLLTVQGFVGEEMHIWRYTVGEFDKGVKEGNSVVWDNGSVYGTRRAEYIGSNILQ